MKKLAIYTEGINDVAFLRDYVKHITPEWKWEVKDLTSPKEIKKQKAGHLENLTIACASATVEIKALKGYTELKNAGPRLDDTMQRGFVIAVVFDADTVGKDDGGFGAKKQFIEQVQMQLSTPFSFFLFPNNADDGELETLLLKIANFELFVPFQTHFQQYVDSVAGIGHDGLWDELMNGKSLVYNYLQVYRGSKEAKETSRCFQSDLWNFQHEYLTPLRDYLLGLLY